MIRIPDELPVPKHHTMEIVDSSKIQAFQDCPRGFFFSYVLGLRRDLPNVHLDFGSAWHDAMEVMLILGQEHGYTDDVVHFAYNKFLVRYREAFPNEMTDQDRAPKNPEYAYRALKAYAKQYASDNFTVLYTETAGIVPVSDTRKIVVKLDSILRDNVDQTVNSMEHKTTGRNSNPWREKWHMMFQIESYTHLLYSLFPEEEVGKVIINGAVMTRSRGFDGVRIPVHKTKDQMLNYLWAANHWIDMIEWNYQQLSQASPDDPVMPAFPINCSSCSKFGCRMGGICTTFPNPLRFAQKPPRGYKVDFWDPLRENLSASSHIAEEIDGKFTVTKKEESRFAKELEDFEKSQQESMEEITKESNEDFSMFLPRE